MEITVDVGNLRFFCHFEPRRHPRGRDCCYAILTDRSDGWTQKFTIPELCLALHRIELGDNE